MSDTLEFRAYRRDPLAICFVDWFRVNQRTLPIAYGAVYALFMAAGYTALAVRHQGLDVVALGGYQALVFGHLYEVFMIGALAWAYLYVNEKAGTIYEELARAKVLGREGVRALMGDGPGSVRCMHWQVRWTVIVTFVAIVLTVANLFFTALSPGMSETAEYRSLRGVILTPVWFVGFYAIAMLLTRVWLTRRGLRRVLTLGDVRLLPLHPDKAGGLKPLRDYALRQSYVVAAAGIALVFLSWAATQVKGADGVVVTDFGHLVNNPLIPCAIVAYAVVAPLAFFGTLATAHRRMTEVKTKYLEELSRRFQKDYEAEFAESPGADSDRFERIQRVHKIYQMTESFPVWPWDWGSIRWFLTVVSSPLVLTGASIAIWYFSKGSAP